MLVRFKYTLIFSVALLAFACSREKSDFEKQLIGKNWLYYPYGEEKKDVTFFSYRKFHEDNTLSDLILETNNAIPWLDGKRPEQTWHYNDKIKEFEMSGYNFKIVQVHDDTIWMKKIDDNSKVCFIRYDARLNN